MALIHTSLIWVTYAVALAILIIISALFVFIYQKPSERTASVTIVCIFTISALLATILLLPVDVALVSSTVDTKLGRRKDWATQDRVDDITHTLKIVYYTLYSLDALLCLLVIPFTYFLYEEYDDREAEEGNQTLGSRLWGATKYTLVFVVLVVIIFLVGFFVPVASHEKQENRDLDFFRRLLWESRKHDSAHLFYCTAQPASSLPRICSHKARPNVLHSYGMIKTAFAAVHSQCYPTPRLKGQSRA